MRENSKPHNLQEVMLMTENDPSLCESWILLLCYGPGLNEPGVTTRGSSGIRTTVTMEDVGSAEFPHKWCKFPTHPCLLDCGFWRESRLWNRIHVWERAEARSSTVRAEEVWAQVNRWVKHGFAHLWVVESQSWFRVWKPWMWQSDMSNKLRAVEEAQQEGEQIRMFQLHCGVFMESRWKQRDSWRELH